MLNNSSLSFNGSTQYGKLSTDASIKGLSGFAFLAWVKVGPNSKNTNQHAYVERQGTGTGIRFRCTPVQGKLQFGFSPVDGVADTSYTYKTSWDDRWHLVGFSTRLGGEKPTYEISLDSVIVASGTLIVPPAKVDENGNEIALKISDTVPKGIYIGNHSRAASGETFSPTTAWQGVLDDINIFDQGVGQSEINAYYVSNDFWDKLGTPAADIDKNRLFNWSFDENSGSTTRDIVNTSRTGTLYVNGAASSTLWTKDRPYLGEGLKDTSIPSTPTANTTTNIKATGFTASWTEATDNIWVQFYELQVSEFANFSSYTAYDMGRSLTKNVTGLLPANNYYWRVRAFDAALNASQYSVVRSLTTPSIGDITAPNPPRNLSSSYVTHSSFRLEFVASTSTDAIGYKIDVSDNPEFRTFLDAYRNQDIGNVTTLDVFGLKPLSSYYVRLRSYDTSDNESNDSVVLRVNTPRQPDITPPLPAVLYEPTGITSRSAIMRWEEGVDDTGVAGYYVDVSTKSTFSDRVFANGLYWDSLDVGRVTSYRIQGLEPETAYYYRVRAYDESGNVAPDTEEGMAIFTSPSSMFEGGHIDSTLFANEYAVVDSNYPTSPTDQNLGELLITDKRAAYIGFTLDEVVGSLESGTLSFYATSTGPLTIRMSQQTIPEDMTWNTRPTMSGPALEVNVLEANQWVEVDVSSLLGPMDDYVVELRTTQTTPVTIYLGDDETPEYRPYISAKNDPMASTQPLPLEFDIVRTSRINTAVNPSFEKNLDGWVATSSTISRVAGGTDGSYCLRCTSSGSGQGVRNSGEGFLSPVTAGQYITYSCDLRTISGGGAYELQLHGMTEASFVDNRLSVTKAITATTTWKRYWITALVPEGVEYARLQIIGRNTTAFVFEIDNVLYEQSQVAGVPFTGNTPDATWIGAANSSPSRMFAPTIRMTSPFLGDSNENNTAYPYFRHVSENGAWIPAYVEPKLDRDLNTYEVVFGPSYRNYNLVVNPSFEEGNLSEWESAQGGDITDTDAYVGSHAFSAVYYLRTLKTIPVTGGDYYTLQARVKPDAEVSVTSMILFTTEAGTSAGSETNAQYVYGDGAVWQLLTQTVKAPANAAFMSLRFTADVDEHFYVDCVQVNEGQVALPYRDGETLDGRWEGMAHHSVSGIQLLNDESYSFMLEYRDPEGFFDTTDATVYQHSANFSIPAPPDDAITMLPFVLTADETSINIELPYIGDDNDDAHVRLEFRRTDLTAWSEIRPTYVRSSKKVRARIPNLRSGTNYTVRAIITDPDGVHGAEGNLMTAEITTNYNTTVTSADPHISFGGFVLMGRHDKKVATTYHDAFGFPERRVEINELPRLDGSVERQALWGKKVINMKGFLSGDSRADLDEVQGAFKRGLAPKLQRLIIDTMSKKGRFYYATCSSLNIEEAGEKNISHLEWDATFQCADPFAYDLDETVVPTFTAADKKVASVVNVGDASVSPYIRIGTTSKFPVSLVLINSSTGERMSPKTTIVNGDRLIIDTEKRSLTKNGVEIDYAGSFPSLVPGGNEFTYQLTIPRTATSSGTVGASVTPPTITVDMRWRCKYL